MDDKFNESTYENQKTVSNNEIPTEKENGEESIKYLEIDEFLDLIGPFNKSQVILIIIMCIMMIPTVYQVLVMNFIGHTPPWRCKQSFECNITGVVNIGDQQYKERCDMNRASWEFLKDDSFSIVTEWLLICDKRMYSYLANSSTFIGWAIGAVVLGILSDLYGRKSTLFPAMALILIAGFASALVNNFWIFLALRIIIGFCEAGVVLTLFVLATEVVGPKYRSLSGTIVWLAFTGGLCLMALQAWLIPHWRELEMILTLPYVFVLCFYRAVPESMRWYRVNNKIDEAEEVLKTIADVNDKPWPNAKLSKPQSQSKKASFKDIFNTWPVACSTIIQCSSWFVNGLVYFGISLASDNLGGDMYRDFVLTSLVEIPANILVILCTNRFGRRPTVIYSMVLGGLSCIALAFVPNRSTHTVYRWLRVTLGMLGKLNITLSFNAFYIWSVELFPTAVRSQGMGLVSVCSRIGAASAPWVAQWLTIYSEVLPFGVMGLLSLISASTLFFLKETLGMKTAETLDEVS